MCAYDLPIIVDGDVTIKARAEDGRRWSGLTEAQLRLASDLSLRITEINYHPHPANPGSLQTENNVDSSRFQFIELTNVGPEAIDLAGVRLAESDGSGESQGVGFTFASQQIAPGQSLVVVADRDAFQSRYGSSVAMAVGDDARGGGAGEYHGLLSAEGQRITLLDPHGAVIQQFRFGAGDDDWPRRADGRGSSLEIVDVQASYSDPLNWRESDLFGGSPGTLAEPAVPAVVVNEVLANSRLPQQDLVELRNPRPVAVDISKWYLSNSDDDYFRCQVIGPAAWGRLVTWC